MRGLKEEDAKSSERLLSRLVDELTGQSSSTRHEERGKALQRQPLVYTA